MDIKELLKALGLDGDESKEKATILTKELKEKDKELNTVSKQSKEYEETIKKMTTEAESQKSIVDKFEIVVKAYGLDKDAEDFDKMLDDVRDKMVKDANGNIAPEEYKNMSRDLTKATRDLAKANTQIQELTSQLEAEKGMRIDSLKRAAIKKELEAVRALDADSMVDMFYGKVNVDEDGTTLTMKDAKGNDISIAEGIADWAEEHKAFIKAETKGGSGTSGGNSGSGDTAVQFMQNMLEGNKPSDVSSGKSLGELFG